MTLPQHLIEKIKSALADIENIKAFLLEVEKAASSNESASEVPVENNLQEQATDSAEVAAPATSPSIYRLFGGVDDPVDDDTQSENEDQSAAQDEDEGETFVELGADAVNLIDDDGADADDSDESLERLILNCVDKANRKAGISTDDITKEINFPRYRVAAALRDMFSNQKIEKIDLRPATYRTKLRTA